MLIRLHKKATTTPAIREYIRTCGKPIKVLARELNLNVATVRKWREREETQDASHRPQRMHTPLSPAQETLVVELRRTVLLSLDDLTAITRAHIHPEASRAAIGRLLKRAGVSRLADLIPVEAGAVTPKKTFKDYAPGYLHIDLRAVFRSLYGVTAVREPVPGVLRDDHCKCGGQGLVQGVTGTGLGGAQDGLDFRPTTVDWREIGRIG